MVAVRSLSESDVVAIRKELSAGKQSTVWFTPTAVGVAVGRSAKVVSVGDEAEGEFIQVKPAGSRDTMFCSPTELTRDRPPRGRKPQPVAAKPVAPAKAVATANAGVAAMPVATAQAGLAAKPAATAAAAKRAPANSTPGSATSPVTPAPRADPAPVVESNPATEADVAPAPARGADRNTDRRRASAEVTVTLLGSAEGEWTVEVTVGKKRAVRPVPVQPTEVAKAARSLPAPVKEAIEASLTTARQRQVERVEQLRAELEAAQQALREFSD
jgi:hypothetical protein